MGLVLFAHLNLPDAKCKKPNHNCHVIAISAIGTNNHHAIFWPGDSVLSSCSLISPTGQECHASRELGQDFLTLGDARQVLSEVQLDDLFQTCFGNQMDGDKFLLCHFVLLLLSDANMSFWKIPYGTRPTIGDSCSLATCGMECLVHLAPRHVTEVVRPTDGCDSESRMKCFSDVAILGPRI